MRLNILSEKNMRIQLHDLLEEASKQGTLPGVIAYNRIHAPQNCGYYYKCRNKDRSSPF
jgi:hypothetical protein